MPLMDSEAHSLSDTRRTHISGALTDRQVREANSGDRASRIIYDTKVTGFGIRIQRSGYRSFVFNYVVAGRERRMTIGEYPSWSVAAAREFAARLRRSVDAGEDPLGDRERARNDLTIAEFWRRYRDEVSVKKRPATHQNECSIWTRLILPSLGQRKIGSVTPSDIDRLHSKVSEKTPVQANRLLATLRHAFNIARRWGITDANPVQGTQRNPEHGRERYLTQGELRALLQALEARRPSSSALALRFIAATGCRKGEALNATWDQFDLERGTWTKPSSHTKQNRVHRAPLNSLALTILKEATLQATTGFVFPGASGKRLVDIKRVFASACKDAGITELRIHDLRHTFASHLASAGTSLPIVGALLGHTQTSTTARYAHLLDQPLRDASELLTKALRNGAEP